MPAGRKKINDDFYLVTLKNGWTVGRFPALDGLDGVVHAVTTRKGLDVNAAKAEPAKAAGELAKALAVRGVAFCKQVHGRSVLAVASGGLAGEGDGLTCIDAGLAVMCLGADCPIILAADPVSGAVGIAHASWRGTVARIATALVVQLADQYGAKPENLIACISPSIGPCCYEVGDDVAKAAAENLGVRVEAFFQNRMGKKYFDLWAANIDELTRAGLTADHICAAGVCTVCRNDLFPSYRVEKDSAGRFVAVIGRL